MQYTAFPTNDRGWQYTSGGSINGISGRVDMNAFGNWEYQAGYDVRGLEKLSLPKGTFYVDAVKRLKSSLLIENGSSSAGAVARLQSGTQDAMKFQFIPQSDGSYEIVNVTSGLALDVKGGNAVVGAAIQQWTRNNNVRAALVASCGERGRRVHPVRAGQLGVGFDRRQYGGRHTGAAVCSE